MLFNRPVWGQVRSSIISLCPSVGKTTALAMKLTVFLFITAILSARASGIAQNVTLSGKNLTLKQVFATIKQQTGYVVLAQKNIYSGSATVSIEAKNLPLKDLLDEILKGRSLDYVIKDKTIVLSKISKNNPPSLFDSTADQQNDPQPVSGRILNHKGQPLEGASIRVKKTNRGVFADATGHFKINAEPGDILVITYSGYKEKEVKITTLQSTGDIMVEVSDSKLDEVQIIAYGKTSRRLSTGNIGSVKSEEIEKQPVNNPLLALQGRVPGLFIEQATGFSGSGVTVRIQGKNSIQNGNDPLYVIDGVPYVSQFMPQGGGNWVLGNSGGSFRIPNVNGNPLSAINPADIESIDVLKDADATAIYGSRAANGAILITTKKGKAGATRVNLNMQAGGGRVPKKMKLMNAEQYLTMRKEALANDGLNPIPGRMGDNDLNGNWDNTRETDWQKELLGNTSLYNDFQASVSGGNGNTTFLLGAGYHKETTVFPGDFSDKKGSVHFNITNASANQKFKMQFSGNYLAGNNQLPKIDLTRAAMLLSPVAPALYTADGKVNWAPDASGGTTFIKNPIGYLYDRFTDKTTSIVGNLILSYEILPGLDIKSSFGHTSLLSNYTNKTMLGSVMPEDLATGRQQRSAEFGDNTIKTWLIEPQLTYKRTISKGTLELLAGAAIQRNNSNGYSIMATGFSNDLVMDDIRSASSTTPGSSIRADYKYNAAFGRVNYNWENKYILNVSARRDGSSRFGPENRFHNFGAVGAAWIFSEEKWIQDQLSFLSFGKLRVSYGTTGNEQIPDYQYLSLYQPVTQEIPYQGIAVYAPNQLSNPFLQWESTKKTQIGLDLGFFNDRIQFNTNYYLNRSDNQLSAYLLGATTGFYSIFKNQSFKIKNTGWEFMLSGTVIQSAAFSWTSSINLTIPKTLLMDYPALDKTSDASRRIIGKPMGATYAYHLLGVDPATGIYQFEDDKGDATSNPTTKDKNVIVNPFPTAYGGFQNTISYKNFQLDLMFQFTKQEARNYSYGSLQYTVGGFSQGEGNQSVLLLNRWQKPGDVATIQKYSTRFDNYIQHIYARDQSDAGISDASYIRLKNLSLAWRMPASWMKATRLQSGSLFIQGQNLLTITNYTGLDPETKSSTILPPLRVITAGLKLML